MTRRLGVAPDAIPNSLLLVLWQALRHDGRRDLAVVIDAGSDLDLPDAVIHTTGHCWALVPRVEALALARGQCVDAGEFMAEEMPHGETWVLVLGPTESGVVKFIDPQPCGPIES